MFRAGSCSLTTLLPDVPVANRATALIARVLQPTAFELPHGVSGRPNALC